MCAGPVTAQSITSFQPESGAPDTQVRIYGSGFDATASNNTVTFGGTEATLDSAKTNVLYAKVPSGVSGLVKIEATVGDTTVASPDRFGVLTKGSDVFSSIDAGIDGSSLDWGDYGDDGDLDLITSDSEVYRNEDGSFTQVASLEEYINGSVEWGDYNNDGHLDVAVTGKISQAFSDKYETAIYKNTGNGSFVKVTTIEQGLVDGSLDWGDYDGDGDLDLFVGGETDSSDVTRIYQNEGGGTFSSIGADLEGTYKFFSTAAWGDYNGDGRLDLVIAGEDPYLNPTTEIFRNDGSGTFTKVDAGLDGGASVDWGDFNGDGRLDLVVVGSDNAHVYRNEGGGTFMAIGADLAKLFGGSTSWGDYNGDGRLDLVVTGSNSENEHTTIVYRNDGNGTFSEVSAGLSGADGTAEWGDFDGDGALDLALTNSQTLTVYRSEGGSIAPLPPRQLSATSQATDSGARAQLTWKGVSPPDLQGYNVYRDTSPIDPASDPSGLTPVNETPVTDTTYVDEGLSAGTTYYYRVTAVDTDGNESVFSEEHQAKPIRRITTVMPENGAPGTQVRIYGSGFAPSASGNTVTFGNVEASVDSANANVIYATVPTGVSGTVPLSVTTETSTLVAPDKFGVVIGGGDRFAEVETGLEESLRMEWGDYNNDGRLDILASNVDDGTSVGAEVYRNDGNGSFTKIDTDIAGAGDARWGDYNGDGRLDIVATGLVYPDDLAGTPVLRIYRNDGGGTFTHIEAGLPNIDGSSIDVGDYNGDGRLDFVVKGADSEGDDGMFFYRNDGDGRFTEVTELSGGPALGSLHWGDYDNDGDLDLLAGGTIYRNDGQGTFVSIEGDFADSNSRSKWVDYNGDGRLDPVFVEYDVRFDVDSIKVYRNEGGGSFSRAASVVESGGAEAVKWGDMDGDGDSDFVFVPTDDDRSSLIYRNDGGGTFTEIETDIATSGSPAAWGDYDSDGKLDLLIGGTLYRNGEGTQGGQLASPSSLTATATNAPAADLTWNAVEDSALARYRLYRDTAPISGSPSDYSPVDSVSAPDSSVTDEPEPGDTYYYRVTAVDTAGSESGFSGEASAFLYPSEVTASANRTFGSATDSSGYRLVALPGQADRPLGEAISGAAGAEWQAYHDDGSETGYLVRFDGSDTFTFQKGNGFWLTATGEWAFEDSISTVDLRGDSAAVIGLRAGWNVISNPTGKDVAWSRVEAATPDTLQALFGFDGAFVMADTFRSATSGKAYYFFNHASSRDSLVIPYPGAPNAGGSKAAPKAEEAPMLALTAEPKGIEGASSSTVRLGLSERAARGLGAEDLIAPPGRFAKTSLRIEAPGEASSKRARFLMAEKRPPAERAGGHTFRLQLASQADGPIAISASNLAAVEGRSVALLHPSDGATYDLREQPTVTITPGGEPTELKVAVGTKGYVKSKTEEVLPTTVQLTSYPNPVRRQGTVEYALPDEQRVTLRVYDVLGRRVATLAQGRKEAGRHRVQLQTRQLSSGIYFGRLRAGDQTRTLKITVVR